MNATFDIASLFATPLLRIEIPPELSTANCNVFDNTEMWKDKESRMEYGLHSKNTYIMDEPGCVDLKKFVLDLAKDFAQNTLMYDYDEWTFSQTWVTWKEPGQQHVPHTHPNSVISGVFSMVMVRKEHRQYNFIGMILTGNGQTIMLKERPDKRPSPFAWKTFMFHLKLVHY